MTTTQKVLAAVGMFTGAVTAAACVMIAWQTGQILATQRQVLKNQEETQRLEQSYHRS